MGLIASVSTMSITTGCISSEPKEHLDYLSSNEDNHLSPEEWNKTDNYEDKYQDNYRSSLDITQESDELKVYASSHAPQSNYELSIDEVYIDNTKNNNPIVIDGNVVEIDSDIGLTVITEVETIIEVSTEQEHSRVILNISDGFYNSYSLETTF